MIEDIKNFPISSLLYFVFGAGIGTIIGLYSITMWSVMFIITSILFVRYRL